MSLLGRLLYPDLTLNSKKVSSTLTGKTILITGATFGIGEAVARQLMHYNVHLILVARTTEKLLSLKTESESLPAKVDIFICDFYIEESITELCQQLRCFRIDFFLSNAGKSLMRSLKESSSRVDDLKKTMLVNYLAPAQLILLLIEDFKKANTHIVNVSTYNVLMNTPPQWSAYVSAKKAMHSWFKSNTAELVLMNITVSNIYLPLVESRMKDANKTYKNTPAMRLNSAAVAIINGLINRNYHFKPWWHVPFQIILLLINPFWNRYWYTQMKKKTHVSNRSF